MTSLITKADLELEAQQTFSSGFTDAYFTNLCNRVDSLLKSKTNRTSFSGAVADTAKYAEICMALYQIGLANPGTLSNGISSISENGASISFFENGRTPGSYVTEFNQMVNDLKLPGIGHHSITIPDVDSTHLSTDGNPLY